MTISLIHHRTEECHHLVCLSCLRQQFQECLRRQLQYREIPAHLTINKEPPYTAQTLATLFAKEVIQVLLYHCPVCKTAVWERPKELRPLMQIMEALNGVIGAPARATLATNIDDDIWAGVFPSSRT